MIHFAMDDPVSITIATLSYNCEAYVEKNLLSLIEQDYQDFSLVWIDDASTDRTYSIAEELCKGLRAPTLYRNQIRQGAMANFYQVIQSRDDREIIICLDGDDWLAHEKVLSKIVRVFQDPEVWLSYSKHIQYPNYREGCSKPLDLSRSIRKTPWHTSHLKAFYAGLFKKILKEDLMYGGAFVDVASDVAMMYPMLEMAEGHVKFIDEVLYIYNFANPIADGALKFREQKEMTSYLKEKPPYQPIQAIF